MRLLYLDLDGVANDHRKLEGSVYCGIKPSCVAELNRVIAATDCRIVLSSAWRYQILNGATTVRGFEFMLYTHGLISKKTGLLIGHTASDESITGRGAQILASLYSFLPREPESWAVVDDLPIVELGEKHQWRFVQTDGTVGLTAAEADRLIGILNGEITS